MKKAHTPQNGRRTCAEIIDSLSDTSLEALERWRRLTNIDSTYLGGRGRTREQMHIAARAWDELPLAAQNAVFDLFDAVAVELVDAIRHVGVPEAEREIDAIEALLGPDHPALRALPACYLVDAYKEAIYQAGGLND